MPRPPLTTLRQSKLHPQVHLIIQLRASLSTLMVALLSRVVLNEQVLTERYSEKQPESPKVSQEHHRNHNNNIVS
jgi:hypothetical protein